MADVGIYTKNADIILRAGANVDATMATTTETDKFVLAVEAMINATTRTNWSALVTAGPLDAAVQGILTEAGACWCAMIVISFDMSGMPLLEAQTRLDVLNDRYKLAIKTLKDDKEVRRFIVNAP